MGRYKIILLLLMSLCINFVGCNNISNKNQAVDDAINQSAEKNNVTNKEQINTTNNYIVNKHELNIADNSEHITDLAARNTAIVTEYADSIDYIKDFCINNSLDLQYIEPLNDRISRFKDFSEDNALLLQSLADNGAETVNYFTNQEGLNVDLSVYTSENTYTPILIKASMENTDSSFDFKTSKLNEFRQGLVPSDTLNYEKVNELIAGVQNKDLSIDAVLFNQINIDYYEIISFKNNVCYYKLVYNPLL